MKCYLVGGAVRDHLLKRKVTERDWVVIGSSPEAMIALGFKPVGRDFPVFLHPKTREEYALARTERKIGHGYTGFAFESTPEITLEEDLLRRDLTINAMAMDDDGRIIDPYHGREDLKQKVLRHVSPAFVEDPVRILRVARFAARFAPLGFNVAAETRRLMYAMVVQGEVNHLVPERIWRELESALREPYASRFFEVLRACGALKPLFPEFDCLFGVPNPPMHHPEIDSGIHSLMVLQEACRQNTSPSIRFAAWVHDLGKAKTSPTLWPRHHDHGQHGIPCIEALANRLKIPKAYQTLALLTSQFHILLHKTLELAPKTMVATLEKLDAFRRPTRFYEILTVCACDFKGRSGFENRPYPPQRFLTMLLEDLRTLRIPDLENSKLTGIQIKQELHRLRVSRTKDLLQKIKANNGNS